MGDLSLGPGAVHTPPHEDLYSVQQRQKVQ